MSKSVFLATGMRGGESETGEIDPWLGTEERKNFALVMGCGVVSQLSGSGVDSIEVSTISSKADPAGMTMVPSAFAAVGRVDGENSDRSRLASSSLAVNKGETERSSLFWSSTEDPYSEVWTLVWRAC
ncbi:hypothetical protein OXX80_013588, partial [Metschnikowia pulcherrima]